MKARILITILLVWVGVNSCKKDAPTTTADEVNSSIISVQAGVHDATFTYYEFVPELEISMLWDAQNLYGEGSDSIDINSDGDYDVRILLCALNYDSIHLITGMPNPFPYCQLIPANGLEIAYYSESFPIGLGQYATARFADPLNFNEPINTLSNWESSFIKMWSENPGGAGTSPFGAWYYALNENYIAIKMNGPKYGWIKVNGGSNPKNPKIVSYAIQN
jgi:hypothetical protein